MPELRRRRAKRGEAKEVTVQARKARQNYGRTPRAVHFQSPFIPPRPKWW